MNLPKKLTTVTPFSKYLAMMLFILFPFLGFYLGMQYQKSISPKLTITSSTPILSPIQQGCHYIPLASLCGAPPNPIPPHWCQRLACPGGLPSENPISTNQYTLTPTTVPSSLIPGQIIYHSSGGHFSVTVPNSWKVNQYGNGPEDPLHNINMDIIPANEPALPSETMTIFSQDAAPGEWEQSVNTYTSYTKNNWFLDIKKYSDQIAGYPAQIQRYVWKANPPAGFGGEWYNETDKFLLVKINENSSISVIMKWNNNNPEFEELFNNILSTLRIDK